MAHRGGLILANAKFGSQMDKAVFPNVQGGPIMSQIAAKAVCFQEAASKEFESYAQQIVANAAAMSSRLQAEGVRVVSGGTDNHLLLADLRSVDRELTGKDAARKLNDIGITLNFNTIPNDPRPPSRASGLRMGTPAMTTMGMKEAEADRGGRLDRPRVARRKGQNSRPSGREYESWLRHFLPIRTISPATCEALGFVKRFTR